MEWLSKIDPAMVVQWLQLVVVVFGVVSALRAKWLEMEKSENFSRWDFIRASVPEVHNCVQKAAKLTPTAKDDAFVAKMDALLRAAGLLPVQAGEVVAVKALGEGYHQDAKAVEKAMAADPLDEPAND